MTTIEDTKLNNVSTVEEISVPNSRTPKNIGKNANVHPRVLAKLEELTKRGIIKPEKKK
jgi:hypothetical protein